MEWFVFEGNRFNILYCIPVTVTILTTRLKKSSSHGKQ